VLLTLWVKKCYAVAVEQYICNVDKVGTLSGDENVQRCRNEGSYVHVSASQRDCYCSV
jgi:hypothetical protein